MYNEYDFGISLKLSLNRVGQIYFYAPDFSGARFYFRSRSGTQKSGLVKSKSMCTSGWETSRNIHFVSCYLNRTCGFHFYCNSIKCFYNEALAVWMLFEYLKYNGQAINQIFFNPRVSNMFHQIIKYVNMNILYVYWCPQ